MILNKFLTRVQKISTSKLLLLTVFLTFVCCTENIAQVTVVEKKESVIIIGSSTAAGWGASSYSKSWVGLLQSASQDNIVNNAVGGYTTYHFLPNAKPNNKNFVPDPNRNISASLKLNPDLIIFSITTNDVAYGFSIDDYMANMKIMTDLCKEKNVDFLVSSTQPRTMTYDQKLALLNINKKLKLVYGENFFDFYTPLCNLDVFEYKSSVDSGDHVHPNNKGHQIIFEVLYPFYIKLKNKRLIK